MFSIAAKMMAFILLHNALMSQFKLENTVMEKDAETNPEHTMW